MAVNLTVIKLRVRSLDRDFHQVTWELGETTEDVFDYSFQVLRSESPAGPFDAISAAFQDRYLFVDNCIVVGDRWRFLHYMVRVTHVPSGDHMDFGPVTIEAEADLVALELRRHIQLLMQEFAGRRCWVLPVRTFGPRCTCWDAVLSKKTKSRCAECFDTGFVRGYMHPIETWIQFDPSANANQYTNVGGMQQQVTVARMSYFPQIKPNDLVIEPENRRWRVVQVNQTEQGRAPVRQELQLSEMQPRDIEFEIPLHLDQALKDLWFNPARNYTNPQNLQEAGDVPDEVFSLYNFGQP